MRLYSTPAGRGSVEIALESGVAVVKSEWYLRLCLTLLTTLACVRQASSQDTPPGATRLPKRGPTWEVRIPPKVGPPPIRIDPPIADFGDLRPQEKHSALFHLTNDGDSPVEFGEVRSTCWCATGRLSATKLEPGESATLEATLDAGPEPIALDRAVWVFAKGYSQPAEFRLLAQVNYGIRWHIEFLPPDQTREGAVQLESVNGRPFRVLAANFARPEFLDGFNPEHDEPRDSYVIRFTLGPPGVGSTPEWYLVETDHPDSPVIDLPVESEEGERRALRLWSAADRRVMLGLMRAGEMVERTILLRGLGENPLHILQDLRLDPPEAAEVTPLGMEASEEGLRLRLRITPRAGQEGLFYAALIVRAKDHEEQVRLMGRVVGE